MDHKLALVRRTKAVDLRFRQAICLYVKHLAYGHGKRVAQSLDVRLNQKAGMGLTIRDGDRRYLLQTALGLRSKWVTNQGVCSCGSLDAKECVCRS